jgi:hypothetical protein
MVSKLLTRTELERLLKKNDNSITLSKIQQTDRSSSFHSRFSVISVNNLIQNFVLCDICRSIIVYKSSTGTGGLKKHLASCEIGAPSSNTTQSIITTYYGNKKPPVIPKKLKKNITDAYLDFIILDGRPFEIASSTGFKQFVEVIFKAGKSCNISQSLQISDLLPHATTVSTFLCLLN